MVERLEGLGLDYDIHDATDWRDLTPQQEATAYASMRRDGLDYHLGGIATTLSQRAVLAAQAAEGPDVQCMLEDDVELPPEFPVVLAGLKEIAPLYDIVFLHRGSARRAFVQHLSLDSRHKLGWVRFSHMGAQGVVITRQAARRMLEAEPVARPGFDRALARYWHTGLRTYCVRPAVVHHEEDIGEYESLINASPAVMLQGPMRRPRRLWCKAREGAAKRAAFTRLAIRAHGMAKGLRYALAGR